MSYNKLKMIYPEMFAGFSARSLNKFLLHGNAIDTIGHGSFGGFNLTVLILSHNKLTEVHQDMFHGLVSLDALYLYINNFTTIDSIVFSDIPRPLFLGLGDDQTSNDTIWNVIVGYAS